MRRTPRSLVASFALLVSGAAAAEPPESRPEPIPRTGAELLAHVDQPRPEQSWLAVHMDRIHLRRKVGLAYTRKLGAGESGKEFSVVGPAMGRKRVGLSVELRF